MTETPHLPSAPGSARERIAALLREYPLIDGHNDLPWEARVKVGYDWDRLDIGEPVAVTCTDIPRLRAGGVGAQFWSVYVDSGWQGDKAVAATLEQIDGVHRMIASYPQTFGFARTAEELESICGEGRIASLLGAEGGHSIGCSLATLRALYYYGVRYLTLTHNDNVPWAGSATDVELPGGLTAFGHEVVREMNRLGMMVDISHVAANTMSAALDTTVAPVIFSHSSARAICDVPRNVPDDILERMAASGGVCMATFVPEFITPAVIEWRVGAAAAAAERGIADKDYPAFDAFVADYVQHSPKPESSVADVIRHIEHLREVAGIDHVGIGGDYDGTDTYPVGLEGVDGYPRLLEALAERGWSDDDLSKLVHRNTVRVLRDVEDVARELQQTTAPSLARIEDLDG